MARFFTNFKLPVICLSDAIVLYFE